MWSYGRKSRDVGTKKNALVIPPSAPRKPSARQAQQVWLRLRDALTYPDLLRARLRCALNIHTQF